MVHYYVTTVASTQNLSGTLSGVLSGTFQRRITVAVVLTGQNSNTVGPNKPVWVTSTVSNPQTCPIGLGAVLTTLPTGLTVCSH